MMPEKLTRRQQQLLPQVEELWRDGKNYEEMRIQLRCGRLTIQKLVRYLMTQNYGVLVTRRKDWLVREMQRLEQLEREALSAWECLRERDLVTARAYLEIQYNCVRDKTQLLGMIEAI